MPQLTLEERTILTRILHHKISFLESGIEGRKKSIRNNNCNGTYTLTSKDVEEMEALNEKEEKTVELLISIMEKVNSSGEEVEEE